jgi:hypothetical protein
MLAAVHHFTGAPLLCSSGAQESGAPLLGGPKKFFEARGNKLSVLNFYQIHMKIGTKIGLAG